MNEILVIPLVRNLSSTVTQEQSLRLTADGVFLSHQLPEPVIQLFTNRRLTLLLIRY